MHNEYPRIGITCNVEPPVNQGPYRGLPLEYLDRSLVQAVWRAGGLPLLLPVDLSRPGAAFTRAAALLDGIDGLLLSGGEDLTPLVTRLASEDQAGPPDVGVPPEEASGPPAGNTPAHTPPDGWHGARDRLEVELLQQATARGVPTLGICRGLQLIAVARGGELWQDLPSERPGPVLHQDPSAYLRHRHPLRAASGSGLLVEALARDGGAPGVTSAHHQGVRRLGAGLRVLAVSEDGLVEAVDDPSLPFLLAVQWHPEWMEAHEELGGRLFERLVEAASAAAAQEGRVRRGG